MLSSTEGFNPLSLIPQSQDVFTWCIYTVYSLSIQSVLNTLFHSENTTQLSVRAVFIDFSGSNNPAIFVISSLLATVAYPDF